MTISTIFNRLSSCHTPDVEDDLPAPRPHVPNPPRQTQGQEEQIPLRHVSQRTGLQNRLVQEARTSTAGNTGTLEVANPRNSITSIASAGPGTGSQTELDTLALKGIQLRSELTACKESGDFSKYGVMVEHEGVPALQMHQSPEGIENFRSLLAASKVAMGDNGVSVLIRPSEGYGGAKLFALPKDNFQTVGGVTPEGTIISICKGGKMDIPKGQKDTRFDNIMDLLFNVHHKETGNTVHFACMAPIAGLYYAKCGAETIAVTQKKVEDHTPGWSDKNTESAKQAGNWEKYKFETQINGKNTTIHLPLIGMRINPELRAQIKAGEKLPTPEHNFQDFSALPAFPTAPAMYALAQELDAKEKAEAEALKVAA